MTRTNEPTREEAGFSLVELLVALGLAVAIAAAVFALLADSSGAFRTQPEVHDLQQRLRAATDSLYRDIVTTGSTGSDAGVVPHARSVPIVYPYRVGRRSPDAVGAVDASRLTVWNVDPAAPQATATTAIPSASGMVHIGGGPWCVAADPSCGFRAGATVVALDDADTWDLYSVVGVAGGDLTLQHNLRDATSVYPPGTRLAVVNLRTYFLKTDRAASLPQLVRYDGAGGADVPVVDHVAALAFELLGDLAAPQTLGVGSEEPTRTTYGPPPPPAGVVVGAFPPGENCVFARDADGVAQPRLAQIAAGHGIGRIEAATLSDGPWCPDDANPNRWDADLLRVRQVRVTLVVEAAVAALRGPAGPLFTRAGTARGTRFVPDRAARFVVSSRALGGGL